MLGLQTLFPLAMEHLVSAGVLPLDTLVSLISIGPRRLLHLPEALIAENEDVTLTLFDPAQEWTLMAQDIPSAAKNSPMIGKKLTGKAVATLL
jgi:dihydroorotase